MYKQVNIAHDQRNLQRILWRWNTKEPIRVFNLNTVTYGMASSSFLAIRCLQEIALQMQTNYPTASSTILKDFYVDDLLTGSQTVEDLKHLKEDISSILNHANFKLRKWKSNAAELSDPDSRQEASVTLGEPTKVLGLLWNTATDTFHYKLKLEQSRGKITKREILSQIGRVYDPLGWIGPVMVKAKIIFQRLWQLNCGWDDHIAGEVRELWIHWKVQIHGIQALAILRKIMHEDTIKTEMHGFCDTSEAAYGACMYLRCIFI